MVRGEQFPSLVLLQRLLALGTSALFFGSCVDELSEAQSPSPSVASCIQHGGVDAMGALPRFPSPRWAHPLLENHECCRLTATLIAGELAATDWKLPRLGGSIPRALEQPEWPSSTESQTPCLKVRPALRCDGGPVPPWDQPIDRLRPTLLSSLNHLFSSMPPFSGMLLFSCSVVSNALQSHRL